jgi:uncharacterized protein (DUF927 family)
MQDIDYTNIDAWLKTFVDSEQFTKKLHVALDAIKEPEKRFKAMLDLMDYVKPKYKTVDPPLSAEAREITVIYSLDKPKE